MESRKKVLEETQKELMGEFLAKLMELLKELLKGAPVGTSKETPWVIP